MTTPRASFRWARSASSMEIKTISVIGAGPLGREIARLAARAGYATVLEDVNSETIDRALVAIRARLDEAIRSGEITALDRDAALNQLTASRSIEDAMRAAELIIDTTIDELETKLEVFTIFDKFARPGAILASCTASLSIADIATITFRAERCVGMRFGDSAANLTHVEIARSPRTAEDVIAACVEVARGMGLEALIVSEPIETARTAE